MPPGLGQLGHTATTLCILNQANDAHWPSGQITKKDSFFRKLWEMPQVPQNIKTIGNSSQLRRWHGQHFIVSGSRLGDQSWKRGTEILLSHKLLFTIRYRRLDSIVQGRWVSHVLLIRLQSCMSLLNLNFTLIHFFSRDWKLVRTMLGSGELCLFQKAISDSSSASSQPPPLYLGDGLFSIVVA